MIVVGAGPAGSTTAYHLAKAGLDVLLLEKTAFPREKVCGDGLTPRATKQLVAMGIDISEEAGWLRNKGLRIIGGGVRLELDWPELASYPDYGLVRKRDDFDEQLARQAQKAGARLYERCNVGAPDHRRAHRPDHRRAREAGRGEDAGHLPRPAGGRRRRQLHPALARRWACTGARTARWAWRCARTSPRPGTTTTTWSPGWSCGTGAAPQDRLLPGYGWIFGMGDGTSNVGLGVLNTSSAFKELDWREVLKAWCASMPEDWGLHPGEHDRPDPRRRPPHGLQPAAALHPGLLLVGDAGGMVNPFNGEGIAYAMESGQIAADVIVQAHARATPAQRELALRALPEGPQGHLRRLLHAGPRLREADRQPEGHEDGGAARADPPDADEFTLKMLANLTDPTGGDAMDRIINGLSKVAPRAAP